VVCWRPRPSCLPYGDCPLGGGAVRGLRRRVNGSPGCRPGAYGPRAIRAGRRVPALRVIHWAGPRQAAVPCSAATESAATAQAARRRRMRVRSAQPRFRHHAERRGRSGRTRTDPPFGTVACSRSLAISAVQIYSFWNSGCRRATWRGAPSGMSLSLSFNLRVRVVLGRAFVLSYKQ
jgi:hypothetical protein